MIRWLSKRLKPPTLVELIEAGDVRGLEQRLQRRLSPDATVPDPHEGEIPLLQWAVGNNKPELAALLLERGASVDAVTGRGRTALYLAVLCDSAELTSLLLAHDADPAHSDAKAITPLHDAALNGYAARAEQLLAAGAPLDPACALEGIEGATPLLLAVGRGHHATAQLLLERGADTAARYQEAQGSALHVALDTEDEAMVALLLRHGAALAAHNRNGDAPLHYCLCWAWPDPARQARVLQALLEAGADANALTGGAHPSRTPLSCAVRCGGGPELLELLLRHGADLALRPRVGENELFSAFEIALRSDNCAAAQVLAAAGARLDNVHPGGRHTLVYLAERGSAEALRIALAAGADPNLRAQDGTHEFPLAWGACIANRPELLALLAGAGARLDSRSSFGAGLLHAAAERDAVGCAQWLLAQGLDPHLADGEGFTPLHVAAAAGAPGMIELLLGVGVDPNARGKKGQRPLDLLELRRGQLDPAVFRRIERALDAQRG